MLDADVRPHDKPAALSALRDACDRGCHSAYVATLERAAWDAGASHVETDEILSAVASAKTEVPPP